MSNTLLLQDQMCKAYKCRWEHEELPTPEPSTHPLAREHGPSGTKGHRQGSAHQIRSVNTDNLDIGSISNRFHGCETANPKQLGQKCHQLPPCHFASALVCIKGLTHHLRNSSSAASSSAECFPLPQNVHASTLFCDHVQTIRILNMTLIAPAGKVQALQGQIPVLRK